MEIKYLKHHQIDKQKWDSAIEKAENGLVYALSWYLDIVSPHWEALIKGDYEIIMPLTAKKKLGFKYIVQPPFSQQLGVFSSKEQVETNKFLHKIPLIYKKIHIQLNSSNRQTDKNKRINYELGLKSSYDQIQKKYNTNTTRNLKKAKKNEFNVIKGINVKELWNFKKANPVNKLSKWHYQKLLSLLETIDKRSMCESLGVYNREGKLLAVAFFVFFKKRIILLVSSSNKEGKDKAASFLLIDYLIRKYSGQDYLLDFEGGSVSGLARFFSGFGANSTNYYIYKKKIIFPFNLFVR